MKELFIINDYDTGKPMYYYLTDNASKCYELLSKVDQMEDKDRWQDTFEELCIIHKVKLEWFDNIKEYNY